MMDLPSYSFLVLFLILAPSGFGRNIESRVEIDRNLRRLAAANNDLAVNIYRQLIKGSNENVFFSPLSLSTAFGMLHYGTRGDTAEELRTALGYEKAGLEEDLVHQTFQKYLTETLPSRDTEAYIMNSANAVLLDRQLDLVPDYKTEVQHYYQASVKDVDFATQGPQVVLQIDDWVKEKTSGKIEKLLDDFDPSTQLVLLNAVYFKGIWESPFDPSLTRPMSFYNNGLQSNATETAMMFLYEEYIPYAQTKGLRVVEMPYEGYNISMLFLFPKRKGGLEEVERSLTLTTFSEIRSRLVRRKRITKVKFPRFKLEYSRELSGKFQASGANRTFGPASDFSGITTSNGTTAVSQVLHRAVIEVNEEGIEAAAATGIKMAPEARPRNSHTSFTLDDTFLFAIIDRRNDMILFLGRVTH